MRSILELLSFGDKSSTSGRLWTSVSSSPRENLGDRRGMTCTMSSGIGYIAGCCSVDSMLLNECAMRGNEQVDGRVDEQIMV